nr:dehydrodolichyl diphosphate synthase 6-like [Tanacetum cinerariifolium]
MEEERSDGTITRFLGGLNSTLRKLLFRVISSGPVPQHIAFIMDGNRRFAKKWKLEEGAGHKAGFLALMSVLKYCYEVGVKYVTVYAFSLDNFNRRPDEVQYVMELMQEKIEGVAYTSSHEIPRAVYESCQGKSCGTRVMNSSGNGDYSNGDGHAKINVMDIDKHMYMGAAPDPDILVRSSGKSCGTRVMNVSGNGDYSNGDGHAKINVMDIDKHMYMGVAPDPDILVRSSGKKKQKALKDQYNQCSKKLSRVVSPMRLECIAGH